MSPKAWSTPDFKQRLLDDGLSAIGELGLGGPQVDHLVVVENTADVHNVVVCTLCSCYPWGLLGLPPAWYKSCRTGREWCVSRVPCWPRWV